MSTETSTNTILEARKGETHSWSGVSLQYFVENKKDKKCFCGEPDGPFDMT